MPVQRPSRAGGFPRSEHFPLTFPSLEELGTGGRCARASVDGILPDAPARALTAMKGNDMRMTKRFLAGAALVALPVGLVGANAFEKAYDPLRKLRVAQVSPADPDDAAQTRAGAALYAEHCAACHGGALEGAEDWREHNADGTYRPPPHDDTGHTWHHSDKVLFEYTKLGGETLFEDYPDIVSAMPGFGDVLSDAEIWAVLAFIKASWSEEMRASQAMASEYDPLPDDYRPGRGSAPR